MKSLLAVILLATLVLTAAPKKRTFEVEVKVFLTKNGKEHYVGTSGARFTLNPEEPQMRVHSREGGDSTTFDHKVRMQWSLREVTDSP